MDRLLILADDLTGSADTAARCRRAGLPATIFLAPPTPPLPQGVIAFTTDSRRLSPALAAERVRAAILQLRDVEGIWYKKIDSTLRGNIGSELDALLDVLAAPVAVVCPAFPAQGRGLEVGRLVAPGTAQHGRHLLQLLEEQSRRKPVHVSLQQLRAGEWPDILAQIDKGVIVVDAMTENDLRQVSDGVLAARPDAILCGSAGLVGVLAERLAAQKLPRALIVVGSGSQMAHKQIACLAIERPDAQILCLDPKATSPLEDVGLDAASSVWLLHLPPPAAGAQLDGPQARQVAEKLARAACVALRRLQPDRLLLVGGDTAIAVLRRLGVHALSVEQELQPGIPMCFASAIADDQEAFLHVVMKPGSFGSERTLLELLAR